MDIKRFGSKIIEKFPEITNALSKLTEGKSFQDRLGKAGSIGALFSIGMIIYGEIKKSLTPPDKRAFATLLRIMFESAEKNLPRRYSGIPIEAFTDSKEEFIKELFDKIIDTTELYYSPSSYLPYHPVLTRFREQICNVIRRMQDKDTQYLPDDIVQMFVFDFNKYIIDTIEKEATTGNEELKDLLNIWHIRTTSKQLTDYTN